MQLSNLRQLAVGAFLLFSLLIATPVFAQAPYLVKDINPETDRGSSNPSKFVQVGTQTFFLAYIPGRGYQIWRTDGTAAGASAASQYFESVKSMTGSSNKLFFEVKEDGQTQLWVTDGTIASTRMLKVLLPSPTLLVNLPGPMSPVDVNGVLFFVAQVAEGKYSLWKTDGTVDGTVEVLPCDSGPVWLTNVNGTLYFVASLPGAPTKLWKSNGTQSGTVAVWRPLESSPPSGNLMNVNGTLYFTSCDGYWNVGLWKTDGTFGGTVLLRTLARDDYDFAITDMTNVNGTLFFRTTKRSEPSVIWKSDGTVNGTVEVTTLDLGYFQPSTLYFTNLNGTLMFAAQDSLWRSDGTPAGTSKIAAPFDPIDLVEFGGKVYFAGWTSTSGRELWMSDGTSAGTVLVSDMCSGACSSLQGNTHDWLEYGPFHSPVTERRNTVSNNKLFFSATNGFNGFEPWASDGTANGATMLSNIFVNTSASLSDVTDVNGTLMFSASSQGARQLWRSNGTESGTVAIKDVSVVSDGLLKPLPMLNGLVLFDGWDGSHGRELWMSDGTDPGTTMIADIAPGLIDSSPEFGAVIGKTLFFTANDGVHGQELWKTDGTAEGTLIVKDILPGNEGSVPANLTALNGALYFVASDLDGASLWKSDGTQAGTEIVRRYPPAPTVNCTGTPFSCKRTFAPTSLIVVNDTLFFVGTESLAEYRLWKSDGSTEGTVPVDPTGPTVMSLGNLTAGNGRLFFTAFAGMDGLWASDGTPQGTVQLMTVFDSVPGLPRSARTPSEFLDVNGTIFFSAATQSSDIYELWKSNGSVEGTVKVRDIRASLLRNVRGTLYFSGTDENGTELWKSDGTTDGTVLVADIIPGPYSSFAAPIITSHGRLFFSANDDVHGTELWALDVAPTAVTLTTSHTPVPVNSPVIFTATVTTTAPGTLTGTVTFMDGDVVMGSAPVNSSGVGALTKSLAPGTHSITANYAADPDFLDSVSPSITQVVLGAPDYTIAATPTAATIRAGDSATFTITATADEYFDGTVTISCGQLPRGVTCTFNPSTTLTPTNGHPATTSLVISTTSQLASANPVNRGATLWAAFAGIGLFGLVLTGTSRRRKTAVAVSLLAAVVAIGLTSCGGGSSAPQSRTNPNGTPSGPATVQVTATATAGSSGGNTAPHSFVLNLTIQ